MITEQKWRTAPPTIEECRTVEFWIRRLWLSTNGNETSIDDSYRVLYNVPEEEDVTSFDKYVPILCGPGQDDIEVGSILESTSVEWYPVIPPAGPKAATTAIAIEEIIPGLSRS